jgi:hemerythrin superfamily protein
MPPTKATTKRAAPSARGTARTTSSAAGTAARTTGGAARKATARAAGPAKRATGSAKKAAGSAKKAAGSARKAAGSATKAARRATKKAAPKRASGQQSRRGGDPDAIALLTQDHREVEALFSRFEKTGPRAHKQRQQLVERMIVALSQHAAIEEDVFYPAVRNEVPSTNDDVLEALEEHHLVKVTLAELQGMDPSAERFGAKVMVLIENVRHHVEEEEGELFPDVRKALGTPRLREIGVQLAEAREAAPTRPHPEAPDTPPGNIVAQAISAPFDVAANVTEATARRVRDLVT